MPFRQETLQSHLKYNDNRYLRTIDVVLGENYIEFGTDPKIRLIWEDSRLKVQVYEGSAWHTCIKGGY
jgi:hypothetical protein